MRKVLIAVLTMALAVGGFAAAKERSTVVGVGFGNTTINYTGSKTPTVSCSLNAPEVTLGLSEQLGDGSFHFYGDFALAVPFAMDVTSDNKTTTSKLGFSIIFNEATGVQYVLNTGSPLGFTLGGGLAFNWTRAGGVSLLLLGANGKALVNCAFSKTFGMFLGVRDSFYPLPILDDSSGNIDKFVNANCLFGTLGIQFKY